MEEHKFLLKPVPIATSNDISKAYYQKGFVICFLISTYGRFMEFLIETYNKVFLVLEFFLRFVLFRMLTLDFHVVC